MSGGRELAATVQITGCCPLGCVLSARSLLARRLRTHVPRAVAELALTRHARTMPRLFIATLVWLGVACATVVEITDDVAFEDRVMKEGGCWAVLFTASTRPEESTKALRQFELLAQAAPQITFGTADVDAVRGVVSEFNMRKRMIPRVLVFNSRARQAEMVRKEVFESGSQDGLAAAVLDLFAENPTTDGHCQKTTLSIGGGEKEL